MAYEFYIADVKLPVTPSKLELKIKGNNKTVDLISEREVNVLRSPGLTEISFECLIPQVQYPFADTLQDAKNYTDLFERLMVEKTPFQFVVVRKRPSGELLFDNNIKVSLEDYSITEEAANGFDLSISVKLKQYREYGTKIIVPEETFQPGDGNVKASVEEQRPAESAPKNKTHTVGPGDSLWSIAKKELGDGSRWNEIYELNKDIISNPNLIYDGQELKLPEVKE